MPIYPTKTFDYNFDNPACYPGSGSTVTDLQGNLNLAFVGTPTFTSSAGNGSYFSFDASNVTSNHLASGFSALLNGSYNCSMSFCIRAQDLNIAVYGGINSDTLTSQNTFRISRITDQYWYSAIGYAGENVTTVATPVNKWVVVTVTSDYTNNQIKTYINGSLVKTDAFTTTYSFSDAQVILGFLNSTPYFNTSLGDSDIKAFSFWKNVVLTAPQVLDVANEFTIYTGKAISYDFSDPVCYPGSGSTVYDLSSSLNLPIVNGTAFVSNGQASYFSFDGSNDYIGLQSGVTGVGNTFTINQWINPASPVTFGAAFSCGTNTGSITGPTIYTGAFGSDVSGSFNFGVGITSTPITANEWTFVTYTGDGTTNKLYKNGVLVGTASQGIGTWNSGSFLMGENAGGSARYTGKIALLDIYNVALGSTAVANIYAETSYRFDNLIYSYDFSDPACYPGTGNTVFDLSGSELDLPIVNATYGGTGQSKYFNFTGTNQYIGKTGVNGFGSTFTINMWARQNDNNTLYHSFNGGVVGNGPAMYWNDGGAGRISPSFNNGNNKIVASGIATSEWYLTSYVLDGSTAKLYVDGALIGSVAQAPGISWQNGVFVLAAATDGAGNIEPAGYFVGDIAIFEVYNTALGSTAISDYYDNTSSRFSPGPPPTPYVGIVGGRQFAQGFNG